nr:hypothetical protein CFP56_35709 [Quercus suber]
MGIGRIATLDYYELALESGKVGRSGRPRSPPRRENSQRNESDDDSVENSRHTLVVEKCLTAEEVAAELPSEKDGDKAVNSGIAADLMQNENKGIAPVSQHAVLHGSIPDSQQVGLKNKGVVASVTRGVDMNSVGETNDDTNPTIVGSMEDTGLKTNWAFECNGPNALKTQAKWTRFNRMDFGLSGITKALYLPTLGKRGLEPNKATGINVTQEAQVTKRGRFNSDSTEDDDTATGVVDNLCREQ